MDGIDLGLYSRLTLTASNELASLRFLLQDVTLTGVPDSRTLLNGAPFTTKGAYDALASQLGDPSLAFIWDARVPSCVRVFGWLFYLDRLNTRANLHRKAIIESPSCPRCEAAPEDRAHLFFNCLAARSIWDAIGFLPCSSPIAALWTSHAHVGLPESVWPFIVLLIIWKIWDARIAKTFRNIDIPPIDVLKGIIADLTLWSHRLKKAEDKVHAGLWRIQLNV